MRICVHARHKIEKFFFSLFLSLSSVIDTCDNLCQGAAQISPANSRLYMRNEQK